MLDGSGLTLLDDDAYEIRAGDCIVYKNSHEAHTIRAGDDGLDVIAFGAREYLQTAELPRSGTMWSITGFIELEVGHPWDREPELEWPEPTMRTAADDREHARRRAGCPRRTATETILRAQRAPAGPA